MPAGSATAFSRRDRSEAGIRGLAGIREGSPGWAKLPADGPVFPGAGAAFIGALGPIPIRTRRPVPIRPAGTIVPVRPVRATRALAGADDPKAALARLAGIAEGFQAPAALAADRPIFHRAHLRPRFGPGAWRRIVTARTGPVFDTARKHGKKKGKSPCLRSSGKAVHRESLLVVGTRTLSKYLQLKSSVEQAGDR